MNFEDWFSEYDEKYQCYPEKRECFEAGQQSKQVEINELQKRIDELKNWCVMGVECNMLSIEYNQALLDMLKILKGK